MNSSTFSINPSSPKLYEGKGKKTKNFLHKHNKILVLQLYFSIEFVHMKLMKTTTTTITTFPLLLLIYFYHFSF